MNNSRGQAIALAGLAQAALERGEIEQADRLNGQSLDAIRILHHQMQQIVLTVTSSESPQVPLNPDEIDSFLRAALILCAQKRYPKSLALFGAAQALILQTGHQPAPPLQTRVDRAIAEIQSQLSEVSFKAAWEAGQTMALDQILAFS